MQGAIGSRQSNRNINRKQRQENLLKCAVRVWSRSTVSGNLGLPTNTHHWSVGRFLMWYKCILSTSPTDGQTSLSPSDIPCPRPRSQKIGVSHYSHGKGVLFSNEGKLHCKCILNGHAASSCLQLLKNVQTLLRGTWMYLSHYLQQPCHSPREICSQFYARNTSK